jgi:hypothetical protein
MFCMLACFGRLTFDALHTSLFLSDEKESTGCVRQGSHELGMSAELIYCVLVAFVFSAI